MANGQFLRRTKALACGAILMIAAAGIPNAWGGGDDKDVSYAASAALAVAYVVASLIYMLAVR